MTNDPMMDPSQLVAALEDRGVKKGKLHQMAKLGQLLEMSCEMPTCLCPNGRTWFQKKSQPMLPWAPNADHYPVWKSQKGELQADNVRLSHVWCNNWDYGVRKKIGAMIKGDYSLEAIAERLNGSGDHTSYGGPKWTAATVRRTLVS